MTLEQHRFELHGSTYMQIFFNKYIGNVGGDLQQLEKTHKPHSLKIPKKRIKRYVMNE